MMTDSELNSVKKVAPEVKSKSTARKSDEWSVEWDTAGTIGSPWEVPISMPRTEEPSVTMRKSTGAETAHFLFCIIS